MYKIKIFSIGKSKEPWLEEALLEYEKRLKPYLLVEWILAKDREKLKLFVAKEPHYLCLDPKGTLFPSSEAFSVFFVRQLEAQGSRLSLVIGDADGLPLLLRSKASQLISLSPLTFTHQMTRLILLEQFYRALEIDRGSFYHREGCGS